MKQNTLKLVLKYQWFDKIECGKKTHEYREYKTFWIKRLHPLDKYELVEFQKGYIKNPPRMLFKIKEIKILEPGTPNELDTQKKVFDIVLGKRIK